MKVRVVTEWSGDKTQSIKFDNVEYNVLHIKTTNLEERKIDKFWELDSLGIHEKDLSVCEKVTEDVKFENNRYVVKISFKENILLVLSCYIWSQLLAIFIK